ncbi:DUF6412 domain-containing protein [Rhodococcus sp. EPR-157]|uniref:DUF6412 domain-containing protein n=1 Tax=Rhodococcus sp. EPR-157 TaxID=1813677 RepID=UPI000A85B7BC|nr:DUF6412 domain-containing protein [Rhodococcus sp. EPR-157]
MYHPRSFVGTSRTLTALAALFVAALLLVVVVVDDQPTVHLALLGLAVSALVVLGVLGPSATIVARTPRPHPPAEERRLRGGFRRQYRPDAPGRPMPRAPGSVF